MEKDHDLARGLVLSARTTVEDMMYHRIFSVLKLNLIGYLIVNLKLNLRAKKRYEMDLPGRYVDFRFHFPS